ncbi:CotH kinase family protein [Fibrivirga algicola]|uniref:LTD domain-containing protein n=1 Tax=Fibrivirga algicola TaxID=2950420 RepID=A0ABX0QN68_9BACT|nr:CotH kinase family protein [Fibrivirga algicola]NID12238.1 hypothetical protein [Fibrivirga algicola]
MTINQGFSVAVLISCLLSCVRVNAQQVYINEIMASNATTLADVSNSYEDWFELYNPTNEPVDIAGYYVTDNLANPTKHKILSGSIQTIIPANGYLVIWASEVLTRGPLHVNFKLSAGGEVIGLFKPDGITPVDRVTFGPQRSDISWGRQPDGSANWLFFQRTTIINNTSPGASNNGKTGYAEVLDPPVFSRTGGFYSGPFSLSLSSPDSSVTIFYTLDGSDPNPTNLEPQLFSYKNSYEELPGQVAGPILSQLYQTFPYRGAIPIVDSSAAQNRLSVKSSTASFQPNYFPVTPVFKGTVVRAIAYKPNALVSRSSTQTYFITPDTTRYQLPVVAIGSDERSFFDYFTGFYTAGDRFDAWRRANPTEVARFCVEGNYSNRTDDWRRQGSVEFMLNGKTINSKPVELAINGGCTRSVPRKSLRLYGDTNFEYPFFSNRPANQFYDRLLLRNGGNDWDYTLLVDSYMQRLVQHLSFDTQSNRPSVVFLNGEYWGVHTLQERYDANYLNRNYGVATNAVDMVKIDGGVFVADEGDMTQYNSLKAYFDSASTIDYAYVSTKMDVANFSDYQIAEIFSANTDWPQNNVQLWRKRTSQYEPTAAKGQDGRFRWMMFDMDFGLSAVNNYLENNLIRATSDTISPEFTLFLRKLLTRPDYTAYFINRAADLLNTTFDPARASTLLAGMRQEYAPYMAEHFSRWNTGMTLAKWQANLDTVTKFVQMRPAVMRDHIRQQFSLGRDQQVTVAVSDTTQGYVTVNTIAILPTTVGVSSSPYPWTGSYFQGNPIRLVAKPKSGSRFVGWQENGALLTTDTLYSYNPTTGRTLLALFEADNQFVAKPKPFVLQTGNYRFENWSSTAAAGTYPPNMYFVGMTMPDPTLAATFTLADTVKGVYNLTSGTRMNGLNDAGVALINTGGGNVGYAASSLGGLLLAVQTTGMNEVIVQWTGGTVTPNLRQYRIRLRYRTGDSGEFQDLLDENNNPVEYERSALAGHSKVISPVALPATLLNKPYVQLLWQYYYTGVGTSGARDQLRVDNIIVGRSGCQSIASGDWMAPSTWSCGRVPSLFDDVTISAGHVVTLPIPNAVAKQVRVGVGAKLRYTTNLSAVRVKQR